MSPSLTRPRIPSSRTILVASLGILSLVAFACGGRVHEETGRISHRVIPDGDGGYITEPNCYADGGPYNYCNHNCHHAANCGLDAGNDGIISCDGYANGQLGGHTVNWDEVPYPEGAGTGLHKFCASNSQAPGSAACCWLQPEPTPNVASGRGSSCAQTICGIYGCNATVLPKNEPWDNTPLQCTRFASKGDCLRCCTANRDYQIGWCVNRPNPNPNAPTSPIDCSNPPDAAAPVDAGIAPDNVKCIEQVNAATGACNDSCAALPTVPPPPPAPPVPPPPVPF
ncbi:MAG: hypothetical protein U0169_26840 [Polyangiaceae bacterium]